MATAAGASSEGAEPAPNSPRRARMRAGMAALTVGALGVVFGDIGTSPLYAVQAVFTANNHDVHVNVPEVYGVISLIFWSITLVVSIKYVSFIMRADNDGEGGIMALTALLQSRLSKTAATALLVTLGILGASLFYGDGAITPAISVLSAVGGLDVPLPSLTSLVVPITVAVLIMLFAIQQFGTGLVGKLFGPVMAAWFLVIGLVGATEIANHPAILRALSPTYGAEFIIDHGPVAFLALGSVVLAVTGAEALYADMGHFGRRPIHRAWFLLVFPALTLNYLAQGSWIVRHPGAPTNTHITFNPFFQILPGWAQIPMVGLATVATVIASQAVISGAYSVTQQAMQLGFLPRLTIRHTSEEEVGQIYAPAVNLILLVAVIAIVIGFGSSNALASAYGVAVTGTFILNTVLFLAVARLLWRKPKPWIAAAGSAFLTAEIAFFAANLAKVVHGGWLPLGIAAVIFTLLMTWRKGREIVTANRRALEGPLRPFVEHLGDQEFPVRPVTGVSVFLNPTPQSTPLALRANVEHNHVLHDSVLLASVRIERVPHVLEAERVVCDPQIMFSGATGDPLEFADRITSLTLRFGFLDATDIPSTLRLAGERGLIPGSPDLSEAFYFLSQITIVATDAPGLSRWRKKLFVTMARNAANPAEYFRLPDDRTITMSGRVDL